MSHLEPKPAAWARRLTQLAVLTVTVAIGWFYYWTVDPERDQWVFSDEGVGYYNLLTRGFLKGQLSLDVPADPFLATLHDPYDPVQRAGHGVHDATYYKGRYYLYFGVTPVVVLFAPIRLLCGLFLEEKFATLVFSLAGFFVSVAIFQEIRRRWFARAPGWASVAGVIALGLATMVPALLRRPSIWEVPISCAYALCMVTLFCVLRALDGRNARIGLALASVAMGLCIGARPVYLGGAIVLLAPLFPIGMGGGGGPFWRQKKWWATVAVALAPIACVGAGLAGYNWWRFGSPFEFGQTYQMAGENVTKMKLFSLSFVPYSARIYLFAAAGLTPFFPFITVITPPPAPGGQFGVEDPYGLVPCLPWVLLAVAAVALMIWPRFAEGGRTLRAFVAGALGSALATMLTVFCFGGATGRYMVDFTPVLVLLGGVGALWLATGGPRWLRAVATIGIVVLLGWSSAFGVLSSLQHNELLRAEHPAVYARVAHAFNQVAQWIAPVRAEEVGPVELRLILPRKAAGQIEPLVVTGREFRADYVYIHYLAEDTVRFGFEHTSRGGAIGPPVKITPGVPVTVKVAMGSLYPPRDHPYFDPFSKNDVRLRTRSLRVWLDGRVALQRSLEFYDSAERNPSIGTSDGRPAFKHDFSGQILGWKRLPDEAPAATAVQVGPIRMRIKLPPFAGRRAEPVLSTGETGKGDLVYVTYEDARHVSFGHDHWSRGGAHSEPIEVDPDAEHSLELTCPPLLPAGAPAGLIVRLDGRIVFTTGASFYACDPNTVSVGANEIQASTAAMVFSGDILSVERLQP
jgi:hypothetical protein